MSGHSKWATMHRKKEKIDAARGKIFTKLGREIVVAVREGGPNAEANIRLAEAVSRAKAQNMPSDNIKRLIDKASGNAEGVSYDEITYEGYASGGVAVIVETMTDNKNRTSSDMRYIFDRNGGSMGASGCVAWMFQRKGVILIESQGKDEDEIMMAALDAGAQDVTEDQGILEIITDPADLNAVRDALEKAGYELASADVEMIPDNTVEVTDPQEAEKIIRLIDKLEENDDVQNVYHNASLPEEEDE